MVSGLNNVIGKSEKGSKIAATLAPWVQQVSAVLKDVKNKNGKESEADQLKQLKAAQD